eukprot:GHVT01022885.1.p1 GENE.GHVT01022885.1~~GHVT01022885.1.p1  ORF type:complete len:547 (+),score=63.34 GHVT01022885.1:3045-4685(+)
MPAALEDRIFSSFQCASENDYYDCRGSLSLSRSAASHSGCFVASPSLSFHSAASFDSSLRLTLPILPMRFAPPRCDLTRRECVGTSDHSHRSGYYPRPPFLTTASNKIPEECLAVGLSARPGYGSILRKPTAAHGGSEVDQRRGSSPSRRLQSSGVARRLTGGSMASTASFVSAFTRLSDDLPCPRPSEAVALLSKGSHGGNGSALTPSRSDGEVATPGVTLDVKLYRCRRCAARRLPDGSVVAGCRTDRPCKISRASSLGSVPEHEQSSTFAIQRAELSCSAALPGAGRSKVIAQPQVVAGPQGGAAGRVSQVAHPSRRSGNCSTGSTGKSVAVQNALHMRMGMPLAIDRLPSVCSYRTAASHIHSKPIEAAPAVSKSLPPAIGVPISPPPRHPREHPLGKPPLRHLSHEWVSQLKLKRAPSPSICDASSISMTVGSSALSPKPSIEPPQGMLKFFHRCVPCSSGWGWCARTPPSGGPKGDEPDPPIARQPSKSTWGLDRLTALPNASTDSTPLTGHHLKPDGPNVPIGAPQHPRVVKASRYLFC